MIAYNLFKINFIKSQVYSNLIDIELYLNRGIDEKRLTKVGFLLLQSKLQI